MKASAFLANLAWERSCRKDAGALRRALDDPAREQAALLERIVRRNEGTAFGRAMGFAGIRSVSDYRERVPLSSYDDYVAYVERIRAGEQRVLTADAVERLVPSSGSTAARKLIPFTPSLRREFQRAIGAWISDMFRGNRDLLRGPSYWAISPAIPESNEAGAVPVGFDDDSAYLGFWSRRLVRASLAVPSSVRHVENVDDFRMATLLFLLRARELRVVSVWHPSFLELLCSFMAERWGDLLRAVADGVRVPGLEGADAAIVMRGDRALARSLEAADPARPESVWPRLGCISCWADGQAAGAVAALRRLIPATPIVPKGLVATEAIVSLPFGGARPIAIGSHFIEMVDAGGEVRGVEEAREGETYSVVVTTSGGLYRYRLHDLVRVDGFVSNTPSIRFVGKEDRISDLCGEKLSEGFVASALAAAFGGDERMPEFAMLAPERSDAAAGYVLFVDARASLPEGIAQRLERELSANPHYDWARKLGQLAAVEVVQVGEGAHRAVVAELAHRGQLLGAVKASCLRPETGWREVLL
ncbi:MAG: GH3 auxin-responsive promoter family protein [Thermoanaerobaculia bacterium]